LEFLTGGLKESKHSWKESGIGWKELRAGLIDKPAKGTFREGKYIVMRRQ